MSSNNIDTHNGLPCRFIIIRNLLTLSSAILWSFTYILYVRQAFRDKSYGMPILALCANITWEFLYGLVHPPRLAETVVATTWLCIDLGLVYGTVKFGPREWQSSPLVARNMGVIIFVECLVLLALHWSFAQLFNDVAIPCFWAAFICQLTLSWSTLSQLVSRGHTRGHSIRIWILRSTGTLCAVCGWLFRSHHYPIEYDYARTPFALCLFAFIEVADLLYPFVFYAVKSMEETKAS